MRCLPSPPRYRGHLGSYGGALVGGSLGVIPVATGKAFWGGNFIPFILFRWTPTNLLRPEEMCCHPWTYIPPTPRWVVISKCLPESGFSEME